MTTIHIDGNRVFPLDTDAYDDAFGGIRIGEAADTCAYEHNIGGRVFSFKVDGTVADRAKKMPKRADVLELVEVTDPAVVDAEERAAAEAAAEAERERQQLAAQPGEPQGQAEATSQTPAFEPAFDSIDAAATWLAEIPGDDETVGLAVLEYLDTAPDDQRQLLASLLLQAEATSNTPRGELLDTLTQAAAPAS